MKNIITSFCKAVQDNCERIAVLDNKEEYSYKQLDEYSNYIANELENRAEVGDRIGICIDRSFKMIAAILGILKAGMSYVPLDSSYPDTRLRYMCAEAKVRCVLCEDTKGNRFENIWILDKVEYLERYQNKKNEEAYVIFTSGSTGLPKGVSVNNCSIMNTLNWRIKYYSLDQNDIVLQIPSISYSSSVEDIFSTLLSGGKLVLIRTSDLLNMRKLSKIIVDEGITHILLIPSLYHNLLPYLKKNKLRFVVVAGESLPRQVIENHFYYMGNVKLFNEYGMTETSVAFSAGLINKNERRCNDTNCRWKNSTWERIY